MDVKAQPDGGWQRGLYNLSSMNAGLALMVFIVCIALVATLVFPQSEVFYSGWFRILLALFCLNIACCSFRQIKVLWTISRQAPVCSPAANWQYGKWQIHITPAEVEQLFAKQHYRIKTVQAGDQTIIHADKGLTGRWGAAGVHLAIVIIAAGAVIGSVLGFTQSVVVGKAETVLVPLDKNGERQAELILHDFNIDYYPDGNVSEYLSEVSVSAGSEQLQQTIRINHPLQFQGITVYQMDYGYQVLARIHKPDGTVAAASWLNDDGKLIVDAEKEITLQMIKYIPDFNPHQPAVSLSLLPNNPKVLYAFYQQNEAIDWGVADFGQKMRLNGYDTWMEFAQIRPFSALDVKRDPGVPIVLAGFLLLSIAFFLSMSIRYQQVQIRISSTPKGSVIHAAVSGLNGGKSEAFLIELQERLTKGASFNC